MEEDRAWMNYWSQFFGGEQSARTKIRHFICLVVGSIKDFQQEIKEEVWGTNALPAGVCRWKGSQGDQLGGHCSR